MGGTQALLQQHSCKSKNPPARPQQKKVNFELKLKIIDHAKPFKPSKVGKIVAKAKKG